MKNIRLKNIDKKIAVYAVSSIVTLMLSFSFLTTVFADNTMNLSTVISGALNVAIMDSNFDEAVSPSSSLTGIDYDNANAQTTTGILPGTTDLIGITNPTGSATWALTMAATSGATSVWASGGNNFDFNDPTASAADGADADSAGGQLTVNPNAGAFSGGTGSASTDITKGSSTAFNEGVTDSVTILTAGGSAEAPGQWAFSGISLSQTVPAQQVPGTYTLGFTLTVS